MPPAKRPTPPFSKGGKGVRHPAKRLTPPFSKGEKGVRQPPEPMPHSPPLRGVGRQGSRLGAREGAELTRTGEPAGRRTLRANSTPPPPGGGRREL